jgi:hypothetical protein
MRILPFFITYSMAILSFFLPEVMSMWTRPSNVSAAETAVNVTRANAVNRRPRQYGGSDIFIVEVN